MIRGLGVSMAEEAFAQAVASGESQAEAYRKAYNHPGRTDVQIRKMASALIRKPRVGDRILALKREGQEKTVRNREYAKDWALHRLEKIAEGDERDRVPAIRLVLQAHGLISERGLVEADNIPKTPEALEEMLRAGLAKLAPRLKVVK